MKTIYIESLGCPRNLVDSEAFLSIALNNNHKQTDLPQNADLILINTCGFIKDAKEESLERIMELGTFKKRGSTLVVTGCLVKRYSEYLINNLKEVDYFIDLKDYKSFLTLVAGNKKGRPEPIKRKPLTNEAYAYLKISDGCNNYCSYCAIPSIRGNVVSEPLPKLLEEAGLLSEQGIKELIVTAMDITQYGQDLKPATNIINLLEELVKIRGFEWIRLLYLHPANITDDLLYFIRDNEKICNYLDIPIQHINDTLLKSMNRKTTRYQIEKLIDKARNILPDIALRTSIIVGHPGETEEMFEELYNFVAESKFNRLGVFCYSREEDTPSYSLQGKVHYKTAHKRKQLLMELQEKISTELLTQKIGTILPVIIDKQSDSVSFAYEGRTVYDAPEIDGIVFIESGNLKQGDIVKATITDSWEHDLIGHIINQII